MDVDATADLFHSLHQTCGRLDDDRAALAPLLSDAQRHLGWLPGDPNPRLKACSELLLNLADDLDNRLRMVVFGGPVINEALWALEQIRDEWTTIDNRGDTNGTRDGVVSNDDLEWAAENLDGDAADAARWLLDHPDILRAIETANDSNDYLRREGGPATRTSGGDGKMAIADLDAWVEQLDTYSTLLPHMAAIDIAKHGGDIDGVMSRGDFEAFLDRAHLPPDVRAAAQAILDDDAFHDTSSNWLSWDNVLLIASMLPVVGDAIDAAMALYYVSQGRWDEALLSSIGIIPLPGMSGATTRAGREAVDEIGDVALPAANRMLRDEGADLSDGAVMFSRGGTVSNAEVLKGGLGLPITDETIQEMAERGGVGLDGVNVRVLMGEDDIRYLDSEMAVAVAGDDEILLGPAAFINEETLVRTLAHERTHVYQRQIWQPGSGALQQFEDAAYGIEDTFWDYFQGGLS